VDDEETGWEGFDWTNLFQDMSFCEHVNELLGFIKCDEEVIALMKGSLCSLEFVIQVTEIRATCF